MAIQAPAALASDFTLTMPIDDGTTSQFLQTDGNGVLTWANPLVPPLTTRGDLIRGGVAGAAERFAAVTNNRVVRGNGTDVVSGQIDAPGFFTPGANATSTLEGVVRGGTLPGSTGAAAIGAGFAGEIIEVNPTTVGASTTTADTAINAWAAGTNELTLTAGSWRINYKAGGYANATNSATFFGSVSLFNVTDSLSVARSSAGFGFPIAASAAVGFTVSSTTYVNITSTKVYRLRIQMNQSNGTGSVQLYGSNSPSGSGNIIETNIIAERL